MGTVKLHIIKNRIIRPFLQGLFGYGRSLFPLQLTDMSYFWFFGTPHQVGSILLIVHLTAGIMPGYDPGHNDVVS
jgi:hypothetical protein